MATKADPSWSSELFGPKILTKPKTSGVPTASALGGKKLVALYFSASWCPPCRSFSPMLIDFYNATKDDGLEIVFVSSDRDDKSFGDYFAKMPWLAMVPAYTNAECRDRQGKLADMLKIQGIPSVIVLDARTGNFVTDDARTEVMKNAGGDDESKKALVRTWLSKEAVPVEQAVIGGGGGSDGGFLAKIFRQFLTNPVYMVGLFYFVKKLLRYLEQLGKEAIEEDL